MHLKPETIKQIHKLISVPEYKDYFEQMHRTDDLPMDFINDLADIFQMEMSIPDEKRDGLLFLARVAYLAGTAEKRE